MRRIRLGKTNTEVSAVSLGTWAHGGPNMSGQTSVGWTGHDDAQAKAALEAAFEGGITHWDTADVYGNGHAETLIGQMWGRVPRDQVFLASKVGWDPGPHGHYYHPTWMRRQIERTLLNTKTDVIDLYYLHHCQFGEDDEYLDDAAEQLDRFRQEGKVRFAGLSDWDMRAILRYADRVNPHVVQPLRNLVDDAWHSSGLGEWVADNDVGVAFFSPLKHGLLLGKYDAPVTFEEGDFRRNVGGFSDPAVIDRMKANRAALTARFADHDEPVLHGVVDALLTDAPTGCALLGMRNEAQARAAARLGEALGEDDAAWVRALYNG